jgi:hypothetical protein
MDRREEILAMLNSDDKVYARGCTDLKNIKEDLNSQMPNLIFVNRDLINEDRKSFDVIRKFVKNSFCFCVTFSNTNSIEVKEFNKNYPFAMHSQTTINQNIFQSMIDKLNVKLPAKLIPDERKFYFDAKSPYLLMNLNAPCVIKDLSQNGMKIQVPLSIENFSLCEISCHTFVNLELSRIQILRIFVDMTADSNSENKDYRLIFMGQNQRDLDLLNKSIEVVIFICLGKNR